MITLTPEECDKRDAIIALLKVHGRMQPSELAERVDATPAQMEHIGTYLAQLSIAGPEDEDA